MRTPSRSPCSLPPCATVTDTIAAFQADLEARGLADRVITLVWSEFGRRPEENASGTDHGAGGARSCGATGTVGVVLEVGRRVEVHHAGDVVDMDAARRDVGGDQGGHLAVGKGGEGTLALTL